MTAGRCFLFLAGQLGLMTLVRYFLQWITFYSTTQGPGSTATLFSASAVGGALLAFRIFDGLTDPVAGSVSDGWVRQGKERRSLLWFSFFVPAIGLALIFLPHHGMAEELRWFSLLTGMFVFFVGYTFYGIPYWSLISDFSQGNQDTQRLLSTLLGAGLLLATGIGFVVSPMIVEAHGYFRGALFFAIPSLILMALPYFSAPKGRMIRPVATSSTAPPIRAAIRTALQHRRFMALIVIFVGSQMSLTIMTSAAPFIAVHLLNGTEGDVAKLLGPFLLAALPCFLFTPALARRMGSERAITVATILLGVVYALTGGLGSAWVGTPLLTGMLLFSLGGPMVAILLGIEGEAITACAEERGPDYVSQYFGVFNFVVKAFNGVAIWLAGIMAARATSGATGWLSGDAGIRSMCFVAGACLLVGVIAFYAIKAGAGRPPKAEAGAAA